MSRRPNKLDDGALVRVTRVADGFTIDGILSRERDRPEKHFGGKRIPVVRIRTHKSLRYREDGPPTIDPAKYEGDHHSPVRIGNGEVRVDRDLMGHIGSNHPWTIEVLPDPTPAKIEPTEDDVIDALAIRHAQTKMTATDIARGIVSNHGRNSNNHADPWRTLQGDMGRDGDTTSTRLASHIDVKKVKAVIAELVEADRLVEKTDKNTGRLREQPYYETREKADDKAEAFARRDRNQTRDTIREEAIDYLIRQHQEEFDTYIASACEREGIGTEHEDVDMRLIRGY